MLSHVTKLTKAIFLLCCTTIFFSCVGVMKSSIKDDGKQIPPDFGKNESTLLVIRKNKRSYDKYLERNFENNYFGKYIIIEGSELNQKKYQDKKKYRYVFDEDKHTDVRYRGTAGNTVMDQNTYAMFGVTDRVTGETYKTKHGTGAFSDWMKAYIQALEKARQKK